VLGYKIVKYRYLRAKIGPLIVERIFAGKSAR
jgi:hypothetical protein